MQRYFSVQLLTVIAFKGVMSSYFSSFRFKNVKRVLASNELQNDGPVFYLRLQLGTENVPYHFSATNGKDANGLKLEKVGPAFQVLMLGLQKSPPKNIMVNTPR